MSNFIPGIGKKARYRKYRASSYEVRKSNSSQPLSIWGDVRQFMAGIRHKPNETEIQATILSWIVAYSTVDTNIEEAVRTIAGMPSTEFDVLRKAMTESGAVSTLCQRFSRCFTSSPGLHVTAANVNQAEAYLYALLPVAGIDPNSLPDADKHPNPFLELWKQEGPFHRWEHLHLCLQSLAFCIRAEILLAAGEDDHSESWRQANRNLASMCQNGLGVNVRMKMLKAAIRCIRTGKKYLQSTSMLVLSSLIKIGKSLHDVRWCITNNQ